MSSLLQRMAMWGLVFAVAGCSTVKEASNTVGGWVGGIGGGDTLEVPADKKGIGNGPSVKYAATIRIGKLIDQRKNSNPRFLGVRTVRVKGYTGSELVLEQDIATVETTALKRRFDGEGFNVLEGVEAENALFEVSGVIKELKLDVKERDYLAITIEATLKEVATGNVVWSGVVTEKKDRFAGVGGNEKGDIINFMNWGMNTVNGKFVDAMSGALMATRPDLFNITPGTKPIPGVTVLVAPKRNVAAPGFAPVQTEGVQRYGVSPDAPVPPPSYKPHASDSVGLLLVNTNPQRARVYLDGVYFGLSPLRLEMEPGVHSISVKLAGYKMVTEKVSVRRGDNTEMELTLER